MFWLQVKKFILKMKSYIPGVRRDIKPPGGRGENGRSKPAQAFEQVCCYLVNKSFVKRVELKFYKAL